MKIQSLALIASSLLLGACGAISNEALLAGLPDQDAAVRGLRASFESAHLVTSGKNLKLGKSWTCLQHSAIKDSIHRSFYTRKFFNFATELSSEVSFYEDEREIVTSTFTRSPQGLIGTQFTSTDRYLVPYEAVRVHLRMTKQGHLLEEWTVTPDAHIVGREYSLVPELVPQGRKMWTAVSDWNRLVFLYATCEIGQ